MLDSRRLSDAELIANIRRAAAIWLKSEDLIALEELIRRYARLRAQLPEVEKGP